MSKILAAVIDFSLIAVFFLMIGFQLFDFRRYRFRSKNYISWSKKIVCPEPQKAQSIKKSPIKISKSKIRIALFFFVIRSNGDMPFTKIKSILRASRFHFACIFLKFADRRFAFYSVFWPDIARRLRGRKLAKTGKATHPTPWQKNGLKKLSKNLVNQIKSKCLLSDNCPTIL